MSNAIFPALAGIGWNVDRVPMWDTAVQESVGGKEVRIANQTYPRYQWNINYDFLRQGTVHGSAYAEFTQLAGFFNQRQGRFDSFLYTDSDDSSVTGQAIGVGDGSTKTFQLVRAFGGFVEPVLAPNAVSAVKLNGVTQSGGSYSVSGWGTSTPGLVTFVTAPGAGVAVTADFSFYWPCRFVEDNLTFSKFMSNLWMAKAVKIISLKS